jgi:hypothetical protein
MYVVNVCLFFQLLEKQSAVARRRCLKMSQGSLIQVNAKTPVMDYLTGREGDAQLTFFRSESACYSMFATNWVRLNFQATTMSDGAVETQTSAEVPRAGDMLCHTYLVISAPAIANVTNDAIDLNGGSGESAVGPALKRVFVQSCDRDVRYSALTYTNVIVDFRELVAHVADQGVPDDEDYVAGTAGVYRYVFSVRDKSLYAILDRATVMIVQDSEGATRLLTIYDVSNHDDTATIIYSNETFTIPASTIFGEGSATNGDIWDASGLAISEAGTVILQGTCDSFLSNATTARFLDMRHQHALVAIRTRHSGPSGAVPVTATGLRPSVPILDRNNVHANYGNYAPCTLVKELECVIGENAVSKVTGLVMQANCELWMPSDKLSRRAVNKSADPTERGAWALKRQTWVVPVPFWFTQGYHSSLPMCALSFHTITFNLTLNPYTRCILNGCSGDFGGSTITVQGAHGSTTLSTVVGSSSIPTGASAIDLLDTAVQPTAPSSTLSGANFFFYLLLELIYLSDDERDTYSALSDEVLVLQYQYAAPQTLTAANPSAELTLRFNNPVSHLVVCGQLQSYVNDNRYGDYDGPPNVFTVSDAYPEGVRDHWLKSMQIHFNNNARTLEMPWWFFHETVPQVSAERVPDSHFYLYAFSLGSPNGSGQFRGGADFSRLDSATLTICANDHVFSNMSSVGGLDASAVSKGALSITGGEKVIVHCFAVSATVAKFDNGILGVCFL